MACASRHKANVTLALMPCRADCQLCCALIVEEPGIVRLSRFAEERGKIFRFEAGGSRNHHRHVLMSADQSTDFSQGTLLTRRHQGTLCTVLLTSVQLHSRTGGSLHKRVQNNQGAHAIIGQRRVLVSLQHNKEPIHFQETHSEHRHSRRQLGPGYTVRRGAGASAKGCQSSQTRTTHRALLAQAAHPLKH